MRMQEHGLGTARPRMAFALVLAGVALAVAPGAIDVTKTWATNGVEPSKAVLPPPVLGKTVNVAPISGRVFVRLRAGTHLSVVSAQLSYAGPLPVAFASQSKGAGFIPLTEAHQIPVGSTLDTTEGVVELTTATAKLGKQQSGQFSAGIFTILQNRNQRGLTNLTIVNTSPRSGCASLGKKAQSSQAPVQQGTGHAQREGTRRIHDHRGVQRSDRAGYRMERGQRLQRHSHVRPAGRRVGARRTHDTHPTDRRV